jgi:hypothetical protein
VAIRQASGAAHVGKTDRTLRDCPTSGDETAKDGAPSCGWFSQMWATRPLMYGHPPSYRGVEDPINVYTMYELMNPWATPIGIIRTPTAKATAEKLLALDTEYLAEIVVAIRA